MLAALGILLAAIPVLGVGWLREHDASSARTREATAYRLAFHAAELRDTDPATARDLAAAAFKIHPDDHTRGQLTDVLVWWWNRQLPTDLPSGVALSADGLRALAGSSVMDLTTWLGGKYEMNGPIAALEDYPSELSADGRTATTTDDEDRVTTWDLSDPAKPVRGGTLRGAPVDALALSGDGRLAVAGDRDGNLAVWDLSDISRPERLSVTKAGNFGFYDIAVDSGGTKAVVANRVGAVHVWNLRDPADPVESADLSSPTGTQTPVAMTPDGRTVLAGRKSELDLWRLDDGSPPVQLAEFEVPLEYVENLSLTSDGKTALISGAYRSAFVWDLSDPADPARLLELNGEDREISSAALSADGGIALTSGATGSTLWDLRDLAEIAADPGEWFCEGPRTVKIGQDDWNRYVGDADLPEFRSYDEDGYEFCHQSF
ncbi:hypothetical protein HerbRD11066_60040 [Herbidospora sp. RD11066]